MKTQKLIFTVITLLGFSFFLSAQGESGSQTSQGKIMVGGSSSFSISSTKYKWDNDNGSGNYGDGFNFELSPIAGYFIIDNLAVGAELPFSFSSYKPDGGGKFKNTTVALAPFVRYYFGASNIKPYVVGEIGFGSSKDKDEPDGQPSSETKSRIFLYQLGGGASFFVNDHVAIDAGLTYNSISFKEKENNPDNHVEIESGFSLSFGIIVVF